MAAPADPPSGHSLFETAGQATGEPQPSAPVPAPEPAAPGPDRSRRRALLVSAGIPAAVAVLGLAGLVFWFAYQPDLGGVQARAPGKATPGQPGPGQQPGAGGPAAQGGAPTAATGAGNAAPSAAGGPVATGAGTPTSAGGAAAASAGGGGPVVNLPGAWPRFRGANLDDISTETALTTSWGAGGPRKLWSISLCDGHAGAAVLNSRVYVLDYDVQAKADKLRCFALSDGHELWSQSYPVDIKPTHGITRTIPTVSGQYVVTLGPKCNVMCCDATTGAVHWKLDLVSQFGAKVPTWDAGQCPLVDAGRAILAPGGKALMIAVELASGKVLWQTPNPKGWAMTHSSIVPATIGGRRMFVYPASGGVVGVDPDSGKLLWSFPGWTVKTANVPMPVPIGDGRIFLCGAYESGAMMIRVQPAGGSFSVKTEYALPEKTFSSEQQTPILYNGYLYGVIHSGELACLDLGGQVKWSSGTTNRFGRGPYMIAGGMIYVLSDKGDLSLVKATPAGYQSLTKVRILTGSDVWAPMALAGARLLARDVKTMVCLDVGRS